MGGRFDRDSGGSVAAQTGRVSRAGPDHVAIVDLRQPSNYFLLGGTGGPPRGGHHGTGAAAVWRGAVRLPPASADLRVLQLVAEKFRERPAIFSGFARAENFRRVRRRRCDRSALVSGWIEGIRGDLRRARLPVRTSAAVRDTCQGKAVEGTACRAHVS